MNTVDLVSIVLPIALGIVLFGLGLDLELNDFAKYKKNPRPILVGLFVQMLVGPILAFALARIFNLSPLYSIGLMLLAASPGGTTSNLFSHLAKGDVALNLTLTAINSLLGAIFVPLVVFLSFNFFLEQGKSIPPPTGKIAQTIVLVLIPMAIGMFVRHKSVQFAKKADPWVRKFSIILIIILATMGLKNEWSNLQNAGGILAAAVISFNLASLAVAYFFSRKLKLEKPQAIAITFEVGVHNAAMAMTIALSPALLNSSEIAIPSIFYSILMLVTGAMVARMFLKFRS